MTVGGKGGGAVQGQGGGGGGGGGRGAGGEEEREGARHFGPVEPATLGPSGPSLWASQTLHSGLIRPVIPRPVRPVIPRPVRPVIWARQARSA